MGFFDNLPVRTTELTEYSDKSVYGKGFHGRNMEGDIPSIFVGSTLRHIDEHAWRMVIMWSKMGRSRWNNAQQRIETRLNIEVYGDQIFEAVRKMRIVRGIGELTVAAIEQQVEEDTEIGPIVMQRRAFERLITSEDCATATDILQRAAKRYAAVSE